MKPPHPIKYQPLGLQGLCGAFLIVVATLLFPLSGIFGPIRWWVVKKILRIRK